MHQMRISTTEVSSVMLRSKKLEIRKKKWKWNSRSTQDSFIAGEGLQNLGVCSALWAFELGGIICCDTGSRFFPVWSEGPPLLVASYETQGDAEEGLNLDPHGSKLNLKNCLHFPLAKPILKVSHRLRKSQYFPITSKNVEKPKDRTLQCQI
jgi:hypothetical protein